MINLPTPEIVNDKLIFPTMNRSHYTHILESIHGRFPPSDVGSWEDWKPGYVIGWSQNKWDMDFYERGSWKPMPYGNPQEMVEVRNSIEATLMVMDMREEKHWPWYEPHGIMI